MLIKPSTSIIPFVFRMKYFVYILKNKEGKHYTGITKLPLKNRLLRHNKGDIYSTKFGRPWHLVYFEIYGSYKLARKREKQIKSWHGGDAFKKLLKDKVSISRGSSNGRTLGSGPSNLGSNPGPREVDIND